MSKLQVGINDLETWCKNNGEWGAQLMREWVGEDEDGNKIEMCGVARSSTKRVKWRCVKEHEWTARVDSRVLKRRRCPTCALKYMSIKESATKTEYGVNDLQTWCASNGDFGAQLIREWTGVDIDGNKLDMRTIAKGSCRKVKWLCSQGHIWFRSPLDRTRFKSSCPICTRGFDRSKSAIMGLNDLSTYCGQSGMRGVRLREEWVGLNELGNRVSLSDTARYSSKKVMWRCACGHIWVATPSSRVRGGTNCPQCRKSGTSYPEIYLYYTFRQLYADVRHRQKCFKSAKYPRGLEYDIAVDMGNSVFLLEYSSTYWHEGKEERDTDKKLECDKHNVRFIQIIEDSYNELDEQWQDNYICFHMVQSKRNELLQKILSHILGTLGRSIDEVDFDKVEKNVLDFMSGSEEEELIVEQGTNR